MSSLVKSFYAFQRPVIGTFRHSAFRPTLRTFATTTDTTALKTAIETKGGEIRELKAASADASAIKAAVDQLLELKKELSLLDGTPVDAGSKKAKKKKDKGGNNKKSKEQEQMEELVNLCKRKGFIFQSSEIYSPYSGFFDYGPLGTELKNNIKQLWWKDFVQRREDIVGLDSSIISSPAVWQASGHIDGFSDPMVDCKESKLRYRADQVFWAKLETQSGTAMSQEVYVTVMEDDNMLEEAMAAALKKAKTLGIDGEGPFNTLVLKDLTEASEQEYGNIPSPATGEAGHLTSPREFNLMFSTSVGAMSDASSVAYLRPETAQGIFTNFGNVQRTARMKVPFGIAQIGKAFRNEITPRNFIFRSREFEQMEIEYFIRPEDEVWPIAYNEWIDSFWSWLIKIGIDESMLEKDVKSGSGLAHYARACTDITFKFPFGTQELMGVAARGCYDLTKHSEASGNKLEYFDDSDKSKYIPHVIEPSCGVDRLFLALISSAYQEEEVNGEKRVLLKFHPSVAPVKIAVLPLVSNKDELTSKAKNLFYTLQNRYNVEYDTSGAIGRRYRRADEGGIPFCITVDFDSLEDNSVTVRNRDSMEQSRMKIDDLGAYFSKEIDGI